MDEQPSPPEPPLPPQELPPLKTPSAGPEEIRLVEYMRQRLEALEREVSLERERARSAEGALKQQEALRGEVETQLRIIRDQMRQEKASKELEEDRILARGRIEALEQRLDEMHNTWATLLKDAIKRETASENEAADVRRVAEGLAQLRAELPPLTELVNKMRELSALRDAEVKRQEEVLSRISENLSNWIAAAQAQAQRREEATDRVTQALSQLRDQAPHAAKRQEEDAKLLRDQLRQMLERVGEEVSSRLGDLDRRQAQQSELQASRLADWARERSALSEAIEEQRHLIRQDYLKERAAVESKINQELGEIRKTMESMAQGQLKGGEALERLRDLLSQARPKEQVVEEIQRERDELARALKARMQDLHAYATERHDVERSLGQSLMDMTRQLELARIKEQSSQQQMTNLQLEVNALKAELERLKKQSEEKEDQLKALAAQRHELVKTLTQETEQVRAQVEERAKTDRLWGEKISSERLLREQAEQAQLELRSQLQSLTEHLSRLVREKEAIEYKFAQWDKEREELISTLRRKDEMLGMLSATFKNLLKKPSE